MAELRSASGKVPASSHGVSDVAIPRGFTTKDLLRGYRVAHEGDMKGPRSARRLDILLIAFRRPLRRNAEVKMLDDAVDRFVAIARFQSHPPVSAPCLG
jgi:hypothetical protein